MKKKIQKPFSVEAYRNGAKVETKSGRSVRILCTDIKDNYPIVAATMCEDDKEAVMEYDIDGHLCIDVKSGYDLVIVEEVEEPEQWGSGDYLDARAIGEGWRIIDGCQLDHVKLNLYVEINHDVFATLKQAKSALAMARISQLMAHDERYGGVVTDEEWKDISWVKPVLTRYDGDIDTNSTLIYNFLAFHNVEQRKLFLDENERLVKNYLMIG